MKNLYLDFLTSYSKKDVYLLAYSLGRNLTNFLGKELFTLLLDSRILLNNFNIKKFQCISDETYKLHSAAKALEGFLNKIIKGKKLQEHKADNIGYVFGKGDGIVRKKIKDKKLIARTKADWDFCRNDIMHYSSGELSNFDGFKNHKEITDIMILLFKDFYGKTEPDEEIKKGFKKYCKFKK